METIENKLENNKKFLESLNEVQTKLALLPEVQKYIVVTKRIGEILEENAELETLLGRTSSDSQIKL